MSARTTANQMTFSGIAAGLQRVTDPKSFLFFDTGRVRLAGCAGLLRRALDAASRLNGAIGFCPGTRGVRGLDPLPVTTADTLASATDEDHPVLQYIWRICDRAIALQQFSEVARFRRIP